MTIEYGARTTDRPVPNGAIWIAGAGSDHEDGRDDTHAVATWERAYALAPSGGVIVAREGQWPTLPAPAKPLTIQNAPGERWQVCGADRLTGLVQYGAGLWVKTDHHQVFPHDLPADIVDARYPLAGHPLQVWANGVPLERVVEPRDVAGQFRFSHDEATGLLTVGVSPADADLTITTRQRGFSGTTGTRVDMYGGTFDGFATSPMQIAAVSIKAPGTRFVDMVVSRNSATGVFANQAADVLLEHVTMFENGQLGGSAYRASRLEISHCWVQRNNYRRFRTDQRAGGFKADTYSHDLELHHNHAGPNYGHVWWIDVWSDRLKAWRNVVKGAADGSTASGIYFETGRDALITGNYVEGTVHGILSSGSANVRRWKNTYVNVQNSNRTQTDSRAENEGGYAHDLYDSGDEMFVRTQEDPNAALLTWHDTHGGNRRTVDDVHFSSNGSRYYRRNDRCGFVARITMGLGVLRNFTTLEDVVTYTGLERNGDEHVGPTNPYWDAAGRTIAHGIPVPPDVAALLELTEDEAADPLVGWDGPERINPPPTEEPPPMYDTTELDAANAALDLEVSQAVAEIRRLEADNGRLTTDLATCSEERRIHAEGRWILAVALGEANERIATLEADAEESADLLAEAYAARDQALADLAACEAGEDYPALIVGGSHKQGWSALKAMTAPAVPDAFRIFESAATLSTAKLDVIDAVLADGAVPFVSVTRPAGDFSSVSTSTTANIASMTARGHDDVLLFLTAMHEMTQKIDGPAFKAMVAKNFPAYRSALPMAHLSIVFQRFDFLDRNIARWVGNYLPDDLGLIDSLGVDLYDTSNATEAGDGKSFDELIQPVEALALEIGKPITVWEMAAPDQGQKPGNPPVSRPRRKGWKPEWYREAHAYMKSRTMPDGSPMYVAALPFNSDVGDQSPAAVPENLTAEPPQPAVKAGWYADTTPEALEAYVDIIEADQ